MAKVVKITDKNGKEISLEKLIDEIFTTAKAAPEPTQEQEFTPKEMEILNTLFGHVDHEEDPKPKPEPKKPIEERIDDFFKEAEKEIPTVKAHAKKAAVVTGAVAVATGALIAVSIKHALSGHK